MAHLVKPILGSRDSRMPVDDALAQIRDAHQYLVRHGVLALRAAQAMEESASWGTQVKRIRVHFPKGDRPELIDASIHDHSLTEVYNQCATIERLINALQWAQATLPDYQVVRCHPTTSSQKSDAESEIPDQDLVLANANGALARFEISDVANSEADGNGKELKDLVSLGVLTSVRPYMAVEKWHKDRLFLVISAEFAKRLRKRGSSKQHYSYRECTEVDAQTCIFEIVAVNVVE